MNEAVATVRPPGIRLRPGEAGDVADLVALEAATFRTDRVSARSFREFVGSDTGALIVATARARLLGYVLLLFRRGTAVARVYSIAVARGAKKRGLGERLMRAAEDTARERGALFLRLEVRPHNAAAIALYRKLGYRAFGRHLDYYGDHADALRFEKSLVAQAPLSRRRVPYYAQTTDFTCGPAAMMMAMAGVGSAVAFDRALELKLWREATTVFMTAGLGGCEPVGMAVALVRRGLRVEVHVNQSGTLLIETVRSAWKREVMETVQRGFLEEAEALAIPIRRNPLGVGALRAALGRGGVAIVLISAWRLYHERVPHWLLAYDCDERYIFAHDPWVDPDSLDTPMAKAGLAIPAAEFERMSAYGKSRLKAAVIVEPHPTS